MKVAQINSVYGYGSTGLIVKDLEKSLIETGNEVFIGYQNASNSPLNGMKIGNKFDWKMHGLFTRVFGKQAYFSRTATKKLINRLKIEKPDVVHLHNLHSNYVNLPMLLSYLSDNNIATVITLHDCWFFTGKCTHFVAKKCNKWQTECEFCPQNKLSVKSWFVDATNKVFNDRLKLFQNIPNLAVVGCSKWITNLAKQSPMFKGKNFCQIYNGVNTNIFYPKDREELRKKYNLQDKFVILGMANKWLLDENNIVLQEVISSLNDNQRLMLVGCNEKQSQALSLYDKVIPVTFINDREQLADIYSVSDVFINLTLEDTLPTVNMEALCCGTPVITYNSCGSPELVVEAETGYVVNAFDGVALRTAIDKIYNGEIKRENCALVGKNSFDKDKQYLQYVTLFSKITANK